MMEVLMVRGPTGFVPLDEATWEAVKNIKLGSTCRVDVKQMRDPVYHQKWFALARLAYDVWCETCEPISYKGVPVQPNFDRFRRDLIILAGHYEPVFAANGELRLQAKSIAFGKMDQTEFEKLFSDTIDAILHKILKKAPWSEEQLRETVNRVVGFL
jgi:hypothetical protein